MEISLLTNNILKIKGRKIGIAVDPVSSLSVKTSAQVALSLSEERISTAKLENTILVIEGSGEYEVEGTKISVSGQRGKLSYDLRVDALRIFLTAKDNLDKNQFENTNYDLVILRVDSASKDLVISFDLPSCLVLYGQQALDQAKNLGKEDAVAVNKLQVKEAPQKMEITVLG